MLPLCSRDQVNRERNQTADILAKLAVIDATLFVLHAVLDHLVYFYVFPFKIPFKYSLDIFLNSKKSSPM